jgi:ABC-type Mn2+/Zn2+ transport system permease subunit
MDSNYLPSLAIGLTVGIASGSIGPFILLRRMALVGDALSHVALPGIALALWYKHDPFYGVVVFLAASAFLIWWLERKSKLPTDAVVGLLFTASLAIGILAIPDSEIIESLFGAFPVLSFPFLVVILIAAVGLSAVSFVLARRFLFITVSPDVAKVHGLRKQQDLALFLIFALVVALGIKLVGTLLMGALTIIPAAVARNVARSMRGYMIISASLGGLISVAGVWMADAFGFLPGPSIILPGVGLFLISLVFAGKS